MIYNSAEKFLMTLSEEDILCKPTRKVYAKYAYWCAENRYYQFKITGFSKAVIKKFKVCVIRRRIEGKLVGFYERDE